MMDMLANASDAATSQPVTETLHAALKISGISLIGIFAVMAVFALAIVILGKVCPERDSATD